MVASIGQGRPDDADDIVPCSGGEPLECGEVPDQGLPAQGRLRGLLGHVPIEGQQQLPLGAVDHATRTSELDETLEVTGEPADERTGLAHGVTSSGHSAATSSRRG